jgi:hypothetical protein
VVFDHLLSRLLERKGVSPRWAIDAQIATWRFLWGNDDLPAVTEHLDDETGEAVRQVLSDAGARVTTLRGLVSSLDYAVEDDTMAALRDTARHLLTDAEFGLDAALVSEAAGSYTLASEFLDALSQIAEPITAGEIVEYVLAPYAIPRSAAEWRAEQIRRVGRVKTSGYHSTTFVISTPVEGFRPNVRTRCSSGSRLRLTSHVTTPPMSASASRETGKPSLTGMTTPSPASS